MAGFVSLTRFFEKIFQTHSKPHFPEQEYWYNRVLGLTSGIEDIGPVRLELVGCLSLMWIVTYACIFRGAKSTGKAAYFTGSFPLVMLLRVNKFDFNRTFYETKKNFSVIEFCWCNYFV